MLSGELREGAGQPLIPAAAVRSRAEASDEEWEEAAKRRPSSRKGGGEHKGSGARGGRLTPRTMCAERLSQFMTLALVWTILDLARGTDATSPPEGFQERSSQQKGRLSLQNTGKCVRPCGGELLGGDPGHPYGAPRAPRPQLGARLGPCELLGWRGMCEGEREARRRPRRAVRAGNPHVPEG